MEKKQRDEEGREKKRKEKKRERALTGSSRLFAVAGVPSLGEMNPRLGVAPESVDHAPLGLFGNSVTPG